jgi:hypothetical protein
MSSTFADLDTQERQRLLDKLAKLKALSECKTGNVNETATAAATMTRIMLEYQIEMADLELNEEGDSSDVLDQSILPESYNGFPIWQKTILSALAEVNHCMSYTSHTREDDWLFGRRTRTRMCVIGTARDIENTRKLFAWCVEEVERLTQDWGFGKAVKRRNDFKCGAASGIADKVRAERDRVMNEEKERAGTKGLPSAALTLFDRKEQAVDAVARTKGFRYTSTRSRKVAPDAWQAGYQAGASMDLNPTRPKGLPPAPASAQIGFDF